MAVTRLKRKGRRNKQTATVRRNTIKQLTAKPVIKNVDVEEVKATFAEEPKKATKAKAKKEEAPKAEKAEAKKEAAPKAEKAEAKAKKETAPKAEKPAKKAAPKKKAEKKEEAAEKK